MSLLSSIPGKILTRLERWLTCSHLNPLLTFYANLRLLPLRQALRCPIYVYSHATLMDLSGSVSFDCPVRRGLVRLNVKDFGPAQRGSNLELALRGHMRFGGAALIRSDTKIYVDHGATLNIGHNLRMGAGIIINCLNEITIGAGVRIGHRSQLLDSNMHFMLDTARRRVASLRKRIEIGSHCWLTNSVTVYGGGVIPSWSVVASGTMVNKDLADLGHGNIIGGTPARLLASGMRLVNNYDKEREIDLFYRQNPDGLFHVQGEIVESEWFDND